MMRPALPFAAATLAYLCIPGHPDAGLAGVPLGPSGAAAATIIVLVACAVRRTSPPLAWLMVGLVLMACAIKPLLASGAAPPGWHAAYFANETFSGSPEPSIDAPRLDGTRIDAHIDFAGDTFPLHYLNERRFEGPHGDSQLFKREPLSVRWTGVLTGGARPRVLRVRADGRVTVRTEAGVLLDDALTADSPRAVDIEEAGAVRVEIAYTKTAHAVGAIRVEVPADVRVTASSDHAASWQRRAAVSLHLVVALVLLAWSWQTLRQGGIALWTGERAARYAMVALFGVQGWWAASAFAGRMRDMSTGDDWFFFEAGAREIALHGWLQTFGAAPGEGSPFIAYPLYQYWLAAVHLLVGEDGFGPVFVQFLVLGLANLVVYRLAERLFDRRTALLSLAVLVALQQVAFIRYYTVTLFAENIYVLLVAAAVYALVRFSTTVSGADAAAAGVMSGLAAITKSQFMLFLPLAAPFVAWVAWQRLRRATPAALLTVVFLACWFLAIAPITVRNYVVSGRPVLITEGQVTLFVAYNLPPGVDARPYVDPVNDSAVAAAAALVRAARDFPGGVAEVLARKLAFSFGAVHIFPGYRPHPELMLLSMAYLVSLALMPRARRLETWPVHLFVAAHLAGMLLTLPSSYGYRLILPPYLLMPPFACALLELVPHSLARRQPA